MTTEGKDEFYAKIIEEMNEVHDRQRILANTSGNKAIVDTSLSDFYL